MLIVRTPVRISFAGGGTDLPAYYERHGGAVLSTAINKYVYTVVTERGDGRAQLISADLKAMRSVERLEETDPRHEALEIPLQVLKEFGAGPEARLARGLNMFLASEIPPGTGLGSSAAVCVNVLKALSTWLEVPLDRYELAERAFAIATERLGKPVGKQDEYAAAFGGLNLIRFGAAGVEVEPVAVPGGLLARLEASLLLFFTGSARDSAGILSEQRAASRRGEGEVLAALAELKDLVAESHAALLAADIPRFGRLLDVGWQAKRRISARISTPRIDRLYACARAAGALGGKITGAGGGGFLLLCCEPEHHRAVRAAMAAEGAREMHFQLDLHGAHVVYNDPLFDAGGRGGMRWRFVPLEEVA